MSETIEASPPNDDAINAILAAVTEQMNAVRWPTATYRVQFQERCTFREITERVAYLHRLGISDLYASPFLQARPGSVHGYDVVNHAAINPEIGTIDELRTLHQTLSSFGMGLIADVVPNHMAAVPHLNAWWQDVLENGPSSAHAGYFDIDWQPLKTDLMNKVLLPVLGDQFGKVLEEGQLVLRFEDGAFRVAYYDEWFPISPGTYQFVLSPGLEEFQQRLGAEHSDVLELLSIVTACKNLPPQTETNADRLAERRREKEVIKRRLKELASRSADVAEFIAANLQRLNGQAGDPASFNALDELLENQAYRLASWRVAADEINYRRFFDVNQLAALCTESPPVFADMHRLLFELMDDGVITGLRIDHPDGLYDPYQYLSQLQEAHFLRFCRQAAAKLGARGQPLAEDRLVELWRTAAAIPGSPLARPLYLVVEKILAFDEALPDTWPVHGTVGYEFLNSLNGVFVDPNGERPLSVLYERFTGETLNFAELAYQCKRLIARTSMASELHVLADRLDRISERNRRTRDFTLRSLTRTLQEVVACFSVYRTYVQSPAVMERDAAFINRAVARAKRRNPEMSGDIFDFVRDVLLLRDHEHMTDEQREALRRFTGKFQQVTGPIMAKAVEDTAFYRFNRLTSLNEVGGKPAHFSRSVTLFHQAAQGRLPKQSHALSATSTHDTKRSEDVRARINVLSEIPKEWQKRVAAWSRRHRKLKSDVDGHEAPSRNTEYLLYQTLLGVWPDSVPTGADRESLVTRLQQYMVKVEREAKVHTSWISPHEPYETALTRFVADLFAADKSRWLSEVDEFARKIADHGRWNSLSQTLLKIASPGVPDFYQGTELWNLTLVDPDNREPVDFAAHQQVFDELANELGIDTDQQDDFERWVDQTEPAPALQQLLTNRQDGRIKLFVTALALQMRRRHRELFTVGEYIPLAVTGPFAESVVAFARRHGDQWAVVIAPRLTVRVVGFGGPPPIGDCWRDTAVVLPNGWPTGSLQQLYTRRRLAVEESTLRVAEALREFPVALGVVR